MRYLKSSLLLILLSNVNLAVAATYYVKPNGSDSANGLSNATAWKSINKVNSFSFKAGDDVYLLSGGSWNTELTVDWSGTSSNRVIIGSYYMNNGNEVLGAKPNTSKPKLVGTYPAKFEVAGAVPAGRYGGMVQVAANYVTVKNIRIENSSGIGINLAREFHHAIFENNEVDVTAGSSILLHRKTYSSIMRNNKMRKCGQGWKDKVMSGTWPVCNGAIGSRNNIIENNTVTESYGEGIVAFASGADNNIIRGNTLVVVRTVGIYVDNGANNIVENNLVVGDSTEGNRGSAFALNVEDYPAMKDATGNVFRNNLAANTGTCFWMGMEPDALSKGYKVGGSFIGNTCVGADKSFGYGNTGSEVQNFKVANNIFSGSTENFCKVPSTPNISFSNNLWEVKPSDTDCHSNNDTIANPKLVKTAGWANTSPSNIPKPEDFRLQSGTPVYGKGVEDSNLTKDYFGSVRPSVPALGAVDTNSQSSALSAPTGLSLSFN